ncbi:hypothetical protein P8452_52656 [Trifolium repens]|nr:hypothetical protein P8452_52656 [Trifolium repens]
MDIRSNGRVVLPKEPRKSPSLVMNNISHLGNRNMRDRIRERPNNRILQFVTQPIVCPERNSSTISNTPNIVVLKQRKISIQTRPNRVGNRISNGTGISEESAMKSNSPKLTQQGCGSEVRWNNKKQLLKPGGELNVMLVLLSSYGNWGLMMMHCLGYYSFLNDMPVLLSFFIWVSFLALSSPQWRPQLLRSFLLAGPLRHRLPMIWNEIGESDADRDTMLLQLEQECLDTYNKKMIWDEIGESDTDRHNMFNQLEQECHEIYRKKVEETRKHKAGLIKWLADAESEVTIIAPSLGDSVSRIERQVQRLNELEEIYRGLHMDDLIRKGKEQALTIRNILDRVETWKFTAEVERVPLLDSLEKYNVHREKCEEQKQLNELAARVPFHTTIQGISNPIALKVLLVGLLYPSYGKYQLSSSIPSLSLFREHVVGFFGYEPSEIRYVVDDISAVPSSSSSATFVEEFQSSLQVLRLLETMALDSEEGDMLNFFQLFCPGYDIDKVVAKLPDGVSLYRFYDCCMSGEYREFTYALVDGLVSYEGIPTNLQLVTYMDRKLMEQELANSLQRKGTDRY